MKRAQLGTIAALAALLSAPALAGDPEAGSEAFAQCQTCHVIQDDAGEILAGRMSRSGPNLYGIVGRTAGTVDDFRYQNSIVEAGEKGLVWDQESLVSYILDPQGFLRETLDNNRARSGMSHRVRSEDMARDIVAFLGQFGAAPETVDEHDHDHDDADAEEGVSEG